MISKILIVVLTCITLVAMLGLKANKIKGKLVWLTVSSIAVSALAFVEMNAYGIMGGIFQCVYRILPLLFFIILFVKVCKIYGIKEVSELDGIGRKMPYAYAVLVALALLIIGIPATGTFTGVLYSEIGMLAGGYGLIAYVGMFGNVMGIVTPACIMFPLLKRAYFLEKKEVMNHLMEQETTQEVVTEEMSQPEETRKIPVSFMSVYAIVIFVFAGLCVYQKPVLWLADKLLGNIFG